jgi:hypothetical protein
MSGIIFWIVLSCGEIDGARCETLCHGARAVNLAKHTAKRKRRLQIAGPGKDIRLLA